MSYLNGMNRDGLNRDQKIAASWGGPERLAQRGGEGEGTEGGRSERGTSREDPFPHTYKIDLPGNSRRQCMGGALSATPHPKEPTGRGYRGSPRFRGDALA